MKDVKITVLRMARYDDLIEKYEMPAAHRCDMEEGRVFVSHGAAMPQGFCESAWSSVSPFVMTLACGGRDIYDGWMKDPGSALISCNDGFRPVSFLLEAID